MVATPTAHHELRTLGIEGEYVDHQDSNIRGVADAGDEWFADFVAVWSF